MFQHFTWRGETIKDIHKWASERKELMIRYRAKRNTPYGTETLEGEMPESFWNSLLWSGGWRYERIE